jgi:SNF2 family DNA or RNA helicase
VPRAAVESIPGIRYAIESIPVLPEALATRVSRIQPKRVLRIIANQDATSIAMAPQLIDPRNGTEIEAAERSPWNLSRKRITTEGDRFIVYELPNRKNFDQLIAKLPTAHDPYSRTWRIKNSHRPVELLSKWSQTLPSDVDLRMPESLRGLSEKPLEIDLSFGCSDAGNDWFDLRFCWSEAELTLSADELQALISARGDSVQFPSRAYRSLRIRQPQKLLDTLNELGILPRDLAADPQRLHLLHLRTLLETNLIPKELRGQFESRLAEIKMQVAPDIPETIRTTLRPYQVAGFQFLAYLSSNRFGGILADDMGLGKTLQTLTWIAWLQKTFPVTGPSLVIGPKSVVDNWIQEAERHYPALEIFAFKKPGLDSGSPAPGQVLVLNYTQLRLLNDDLKRIHWDAVVFDEGQYLKNTASQTTRSAHVLNAHHKILLTGTPIENKLLDLWSLMHCVMPGALGTQRSFKRDFQDSGDSESRSRLARRARPFLLRRAKEEVAVELPPKIEEDIRVSMEGEQEDLYRAELKLARQNLLNIENGDQLDKERFNLLTSLLRLRQICCHPVLAGSKSGTETSAKLEALADLLEPLIEQENKILVFSQFVEMLHLIEDRVQGLGCPIFKLTGQTEHRGDLVDKFQREEGAGLFLISLKAGGTGINLAAASYVILFDPWWNPAVENQAIDRVHRIGQTKTVFAYRLLMRDTIEDKIRQLQVRKSNLAKEVLGEEAFGRALTLDDFRYLLS